MEHYLVEVIFIDGKYKYSSHETYEAALNDIEFNWSDMKNLKEINLYDHGQLVHHKGFN